MNSSRFRETGFHIETVADHTCQGISRIKTRLYLTLAFRDGALQAATPPCRKWRTDSWAAGRYTPNLFQLSWFVGSRIPVKTEHLKCLILGTRLKRLVLLADTYPAPRLRNSRILSCPSKFVKPKTLWSGPATRNLLGIFNSSKVVSGRKI